MTKKQKKPIKKPLMTARIHDDIQECINLLETVERDARIHAYILKEIPRTGILTYHELASIYTALKRVKAYGNEAVKELADSIGRKTHDWD